MENDTIIHMLLSAYCELVYFIVNHLSEYVNNLAGTFKVFKNKIESKQYIVGVLIVIYSETYCLSHVKVCKIVAENERYNVN